MIIQTAKNSPSVSNRLYDVSNGFGFHLLRPENLQDGPQEPPKSPSHSSSLQPSKKPAPAAAEDKVWDERIWRNPNSPPVQRYGLIIDTTNMFPECNNRDHNCNERRGSKIDYVAFHYTVFKTLAETVAAFNKGEMKPNDRIGGSSHYVIDTDGKVYQFVPEEKRAWHTAKNSTVWEEINPSSAVDFGSRSISIELVNPGKTVAPGKDGKPDLMADCTNTLNYETQPVYTPAQLKSLRPLAKGLKEKYDIPAQNFVGHADIKLDKCDPGTKFPWKELAKDGIGLWVKSAALNKKGDSYYFGQKAEGDENLQKTIAHWQDRLRSAGYTSLAANGKYDETMKKVVQAFQIHHRPERVDGILDPSTQDTLERYIAALEKAKSGQQTASTKKIAAQ